ncbi:MAG: hypothetical protein ABL874_00745 [Sphingopyxis sp.]
MAKLKQVGIDVDVSLWVEQHRRAFSQTHNDILREIAGIDSKPTASALKQHGWSGDTTARGRGLWSFSIDGQRYEARSLKDAYLQMLQKLHTRNPDILGRLATEKGRSRRYVARSAEALYALGRSDLATKFAAELVPGWYADTNLSEAQVVKRTKSAAFHSGLRYGSDLFISEGLRVI